MKKINTILFDLDGTLLQFNYKEFMDVYMSLLSKVFTGLQMDTESALKALWAGTKAMVQNNGDKTNSDRFWDVFSEMMGLSGDRFKSAEKVLENFYTNEFDTIKSILKNTDPELPHRMIRSLKSRGFCLVLATNPLFPMCAVTTRLKWVGLEPDDFYLVTNYSNSSYCKPNPYYYKEIFNKIGKQPDQCLMVGNNVDEDMCAGDLGAETFLVTDYLENKNETDISLFRHGTLNELESYLEAYHNEKIQMGHFSSGKYRA